MDQALSAGIATAASCLSASAVSGATAQQITGFGSNPT
jgi:hypothetical protein